MQAITQALYALAEALIPYTNHIRADPRLPWLNRNRAAARLSHIIQQLLALTARLDPHRVGSNAFAPLRPARPRRHPAAPTHPSSRPLSARQLATRIAALLAELEAIARETGHPLPKIIQHLARHTQTLAGCEALRLPPPSPHQAQPRQPGAG